MKILKRALNWLVNGRPSPIEAAMRDEGKSPEAEQPAASKVTKHTSPKAKQPDAKDYGNSGFWQYEEVRAALYKHVTFPSEIGVGFSDLRGKSLTVTVSEDGLHVTIEEV